MATEYERSKTREVVTEAAVAAVDNEYLVITSRWSGKLARFRVPISAVHAAISVQSGRKRTFKPSRVVETKPPSSLADAARSLANALQLDDEGATELLRDLVREQGLRDSPGHSSLSEHEQEVLRDAGVVLPEFDLPFAERPSVQSKIRRAQIASEALTTAAVAERLHVSPSRVRQRAADRSLFALPSGEHETRRFPTFQFTDDGELPNWGVVARSIPRGTSPVRVEAFLNTPQVDLQDPDGGDPLTPRAWLEHHLDAQRVAGLVAGFSAT